MNASLAVEMLAVTLIFSVGALAAEQIVRERHWSAVALLLLVLIPLAFLWDPSGMVALFKSPLVWEIPLAIFVVALSALFGGAVGYVISKALVWAYWTLWHIPPPSQRLAQLEARTREMEREAVREGLLLDRGE